MGKAKIEANVEKAAQEHEAQKQTMESLVSEKKTEGKDAQKLAVATSKMAYDKGVASAAQNVVKRAADKTEAKAEAKKAEQILEKKKKEVKEMKVEASAKKAEADNTKQKAKTD